MRSNIANDINLASSRIDPPMSPDQFQELLKTLKFTNGNDSGFVLEKYRKTYKAIFESQVTEFHFDGLGWSFPLVDLWETALRHCADSLLELDLSDNDLTGDVAIFSGLRSVMKLNLNRNRKLTGNISAFK